MTIEERIFKISDYFVTLNCAKEDEAAYVLVRFPNNWKLANETQLKKDFGVQVGIREEGCYFVGEIKNGFDKIFDAIDYVIKYNLSLAERKTLFEQKIEELTKLFKSEPIERLKTLEFTLRGVKVPSTTQKSSGGRGGRTQKSPISEILNKPEEEPVKKEAEEFITEITPDSPTTTTVTNGDNDLMQMVKNTIES